MSISTVCPDIRKTSERRQQLWDCEDAAGLPEVEPDPLLDRRSALKRFCQNSGSGLGLRHKCGPERWPGELKIRRKKRWIENHLTRRHEIW